MNPSAQDFYEHKTQTNMNLTAQDVFLRLYKNLWTQDTKSFMNLRPQNSMKRRRMHLGGRARPPPQPLSSCLFKAYLLCRDSSPPPETSPPPIETIEKNYLPK